MTSEWATVPIQEGESKEEEEEKKKKKNKMGVFCFFFWVGFDGGSKASISLMVTWSLSKVLGVFGEKGKIGGRAGGGGGSIAYSNSER